MKHLSMKTMTCPVCGQDTAAVVQVDIRAEPGLLGRVRARARVEGVRVSHVCPVLADERDSLPDLAELLDLIRWQGGAVTLGDVKIQPCDTYGQTEAERALSAVRQERDELLRDLEAERARREQARPEGAGTLGQFYGGATLEGDEGGPSV